MVSPTGNVQPSIAASTLLSATTSSISSSSFSQQLEAALEQYLGQSGNGSQLQIDIQPAQGQDSGASQFLVTVKALPAASAAATAAAPATVAQPAAAAQPVQPASSPASPQISDAAPADYVNMPFGNGSSTVPSLATALASQDAMMQSTFMTKAAILNEDAVSAAGDPMSGQTVLGTNLKWDDLTQDQQFAYIYSCNCGLPQGQSMQQYLDASLGPKIMANAPSNNPMLFGTI
jgi:hypothetical protein